MQDFWATAVLLSMNHVWKSKTGKKLSKHCPVLISKKDCSSDLSSHMPTDNVNSGVTESNLLLGHFKSAGIFYPRWQRLPGNCQLGQHAGTARGCLHGRRPEVTCNSGVGSFMWWAASASTYVEKNDFSPH